MKLVTIPCWCLLLLSVGACGGQSSSDTGGGQALESISDTARTAGSGGILDASFGTGGMVTTAVGSSDKASAILIQPDGKIVEVGTATIAGKKELALVRYLPDGQLDSSFGAGGVTHAPTGPGGGEVGGAALQADGKILVVGYFINASSNDIAILRFNQDGSVDSAWGNRGAMLSTDANNEVALGIAIQPDTRIIVAGSSSSGSRSEFMVARLTASGELDHGFGTQGVVKFPIPSSGDADSFAIAQNVAVRPDGTLIVAGTLCKGLGSQATYEGVAVRLQPDGSLDPRFGSSGATVPVPGFLTSFLAHKDGRIYLGMYQGGTSSYRIYRLTQDGLADSSFGSGGFASPVLPMDVMSLTEDPAGGIVAAGQNPVIYNVMLQRFRNDGTADPSFGLGGVVTAAFSTFDASLSAMLDANGRLVVGGLTSPKAPATQFLLARFRL